MSNDVTAPVRKQYSHYHKRVPTGVTHIDVYRVLQMWDVRDPCLQHALKKLLVAGGRGSKGVEKDVAEAIASLQRWQEMHEEDQAPGPATPAAPPAPWAPAPAPQAPTRPVNSGLPPPALPGGLPAAPQPPAPPPLPHGASGY